MDQLRRGRGEYEKSLHEIRHTIEGLEYRTLFFVYNDRMVLVHFFHKTTRKTPVKEIALGWERMKAWVREQKLAEARARKKGK